MKEGERVSVLNHMSVQVLIVLNWTKTGVLTGGVHFLHL
jgi:hypothetical protein